MPERWSVGAFLCGPTVCFALGMDLDTLAHQTSVLVNESRALISRIAATAGYTERKKVACNSYRIIDDAKLALQRADLLIGWVDAPRLPPRVPERRQRNVVR